MLRRRAVISESDVDPRIEVGSAGGNAEGKIGRLGSGALGYAFKYCSAQCVYNMCVGCADFTPVKCLGEFACAYDACLIVEA